jgi:hypothetical protein
LSSKAKPMNHPCGFAPVAFCAVPVLPPTVKPEMFAF